MAYDKSKDKYAEYTYNVVHHNVEYFNGLFRTPGMRKAIPYQWDPETGVNMNPDEEYIDPARINRILQYYIFSHELADFLHYAVAVSLKHPGTKFWLCNSKDGTNRQRKFLEARKEWVRSHPDDYFFPDWIVKGDAGIQPTVAGVCENGEWRIREKYCGIVEMILPGGMPKNFHRVA